MSQICSLLPNLHTAQYLGSIPLTQKHMAKFWEIKAENKVKKILWLLQNNRNWTVNKLPHTILAALARAVAYIIKSWNLLLILHCNAPSLRRCGSTLLQKGLFFRRYHVSFNKTTRIHDHTPHADPARMLQKHQLS